MATTKFGLYGKMTAQEGQRDALAAILLEAADVLQDFEGCHMYVVNLPEDDPNTIWVTEIWADADAHAASLQIEAVKALIQRGRPLIAGGEGIKLRTLGGKGI